MGRTITKRTPPKAPPKQIPKNQPTRPKTTPPPTPGKPAPRTLPVPQKSGTTANTPPILGGPRPNPNGPRGNPNGNPTDNAPSPGPAPGPAHPGSTPGAPGPGTTPGSTPTSPVFNPGLDAFQAWYMTDPRYQIQNPQWAAQQNQLYAQYGWVPDGKGGYRQASEAENPFSITNELARALRRQSGDVQNNANARGLLFSGAQIAGQQQAARGYEKNLNDALLSFNSALGGISTNKTNFLTDLYNEYLKTAPPAGTTSAASGGATGTGGATGGGNATAGNTTGGGSAGSVVGGAVGNGITAGSATGSSTGTGTNHQTYGPPQPIPQVATPGGRPRQVKKAFTGGWRPTVPKPPGFNPNRTKVAQARIRPGLGGGRV